MISIKASFHLFNFIFDSAILTASPKNSFCCAEISCVLKLLITSPPQLIDLSAGA